MSTMQLMRRSRGTTGGMLLAALALGALLSHSGSSNLLCARFGAEFPIEIPVPAGSGHEEDIGSTGRLEKLSSATKSHQLRRKARLQNLRRIFLYRWAFSDRLAGAESFAFPGSQGPDLSRLRQLRL